MIPHTAAPSDEDALASLGLAPSAPAHRAECVRIARHIRDSSARVIGFVPSDNQVGVPALLVHLGLALCELTGGTAAVVDANVRYPGLAAHGDRTLPSTVFATRWIRGALALLSPAHAEHAGEVVPQLARALLECTELFGHVLVDLTGFELLGEHATAAACMDAVAIVGRARVTREADLVRLAPQMPRRRFLGVLLVA
ncbi:hypothetical protein BH11MYX2_BH11MYX2_31420 [soil metagenome]